MEWIVVSIGKTSNTESIKFRPRTRTKRGVKNRDSYGGCERRGEGKTRTTTRASTRTSIEGKKVLA